MVNGLLLSLTHKRTSAHTKYAKHTHTHMPRAHMRTCAHTY